MHEKQPAQTASALKETNMIMDVPKAVSRHKKLCSPAAEDSVNVPRLLGKYSKQEMFLKRTAHAIWTWIWSTKKKTLILMYFFVVFSMHMVFANIFQ